MRLNELLQREKVRYAMDEHPETNTAIGLAVAEEVSGHQVIKPVVVEADGTLVMCALPADRRLDMSALRAVLGTGRIRLISEDELADVCPDCELGAEPPIGRLFGMETLMDESLLPERMVIFQAGTHHTAVRMSVDEFHRIANPRVVNISRLD